MALRRKHGGRQRWHVLLGGFLFQHTAFNIGYINTQRPFFFFLSFLHLAGETLHTTTHTEYNLTITCMDKEENTTHKYKNKGGRFSLPELNLAWIRRLFFFPQLFCFPFFFFFVHERKIFESRRSSHLQSSYLFTDQHLLFAPGMMDAEFHKVHLLRL